MFIASSEWTKKTELEKVIVLSVIALISVTPVTKKRRRNPSPSLLISVYFNKF
jgi:hypothetical protein